MTTENYLNLGRSELDRHVYRIMKQDHVVSLFVDELNVLSQIQNWKDKFENFQMRLGGVLDGERFQFGTSGDFVGQCWTSNGLSEAMWGIYANDPDTLYLRVRSTPRKLLKALIDAHPQMPQDTCFVGGVKYKSEKELKALLQNRGALEVNAISLANALLLKRKAFKHESEVRLLYYGDAKDYDQSGLYRYKVDPHQLITQIMADPNRDRKTWRDQKAIIQRDTRFTGEIRRSKIYDPPEWEAPHYTS